MADSGWQRPALAGLAPILEEPMKVDGKLGAWPATAVADEARRHEKAGYDGLWCRQNFPRATPSCRW